MRASDGWGDDQEASSVDPPDAQVPSDSVAPVETLAPAPTSEPDMFVAVFAVVSMAGFGGIYLYEVCKPNHPCLF